MMQLKNNIGIKELYICFSKEMEIIDYNQADESLSQWSIAEKEMQGKVLFEVINEFDIPSELVEILKNHILNSLNNNKDESFEYNGYYIEVKKLAKGGILKVSRKSNGQSDSDNQFKLISDKYREITGDPKFKIRNAYDYVNAIQKYYQHIISHMPGNVYWMDKDCKMLGCNENTYKMVGLDSLDEFIGLTYEEVGQIAGWKEGQEQSFKKDDLHVIKTKQAILNKIEPTLYDENGKPVNYITNRVPLFNDENEVIGVIGISIDITEQLEAEKKERAAIAKRIKAEQKVEVLEKQTKALKRQSSTITHEINTALASVILGLNSLTKLIKDRVKDEIINSFVSKIEPKLNANISRIKYFIESIKTNVSDFEDISQEKLSSKAIIRDVITTYPFATSEESKLISSVEVDDFFFSGNKTLMIHLFFNLLKNAIFFIKKSKKGEIQIWTDKDNNYNYIIFMDTGAGIPDEKLEKIFQEYYTDTGVGTGVGLFFCKRVMNSIGGEINCESKTGEFTKFTLSFPIDYNINK